MGTKLVYLHGRILLGNNKVVTQLLSQTGMNWTDFMLNDGSQVEKQKQTKPLTFHLYDILGHVKLLREVEIRPSGNFSWRVCQ